MPKLRKRTFEFTTASARETRVLAELIGRRIESGACISLVGALGAGKTVFVTGLCRGLGVDEDVVSPTFVLYEEFEGRLPVVHVDLYRLEHEQEIEELGLFDLTGSNRVLAVEWGDRSEYLFDASDIVVHLALSGEQSRAITITCLPAFDRWFEDLEPHS